MAEIDKNLDKAIDEHIKRVFDRYKADSKIFSATHIGHITVSIVFLFSILFPFLYLQIEARDNDLEIQRLSGSVQEHEQRIAAYHQAMTGLKKVFEMVENAPKPLKAYIQSLESEAAGGPKAAYPEGMAETTDACGPPADRDAWMSCRIGQYMKDRFAQNRRLLAEEVAAPLKSQNIPESDQWRTDLQAGMQDLLEQSRKKMAADPTFWKDFNQDSPIYRSMVEGAHQFWVNHNFEEIEDKMRQETESLQNDVQALNQKKEGIQKREEELNGRLKNIKTRFGKVGMELGDAILFAPVIFSAVFLLAVTNLMGSIRLRKSFQRMMQFKDPDKIAITDDEIALTMPLWLDPLDPPAKRNLRAFILMIPVVVAVLTLIVIVYCMRIPGAFSGLTGADYWKYFFYYLLSAGLFVHGFRKIHGAIKGHGVPPLSVDKARDKASGEAS